MNAASEATVNVVRPPSNYSSFDETKREQRRGINNGHPQRNGLLDVRTLRNRVHETHGAGASMHAALSTLFLTHDCADMNGPVGRERVVVRVTREVMALRQSGT